MSNVMCFLCHMKIMIEKEFGLDWNYFSDVICKQLLRSGTSIGANIKEAIRGYSKADFASKVGIALKEASETEYWIELLRDTDYISRQEADSMLADCIEIIKITTSIIKSSKTTPWIKVFSWQPYPLSNNYELWIIN